jgi:hypothetical protein
MQKNMIRNQLAFATHVGILNALLLLCYVKSCRISKSTENRKQAGWTGVFILSQQSAETLAETENLAISRFGDAARVFNKKRTIPACTYQTGEVLVKDNVPIGPVLNAVKKIL